MAAAGGSPPLALEFEKEGGKKTPKPSEAPCTTSDVGQWQPQGSDSFLTRDWLPKTHGFLSGPLLP